MVHKAEQRAKGGGPQRLLKHLRQGTLLPIISNSVRNDWIFDVDFNKNLGAANDQKPPAAVGLNTISQQLALRWAAKMGYPFKIPPEIETDDEDVSWLWHIAQFNQLARVAQYNRVVENNNIVAEANEAYLTFLKEELLAVARDDDNIDDEIIEELRRELGNYSFSELVQELGYPYFTEEHPDTLRRLAQLPIKIYVTTSYYDFLERLLQAEGKHPLTQICFYDHQPQNLKPEHKPEPHFEPSVEQPIVYHLFGFEPYKESLVLTEDDFLDFLMTVTENKDNQKPLIPLKLREAIAASTLLLLGYRLQDTDFRVLFRGIIKPFNPQAERKLDVAIQLDPERQDEIKEKADAQNYLERYFEASKFTVEWSTADEFICQLWEIWKEE